jgi:two-component sensor histidine kinase
MDDRAHDGNPGNGPQAEVESLRRQVAAAATERDQREREMQRQLRNILSVIRSIVHRTEREAESIEDYGLLLDGRISAFARVQSLLLFDPAAGIDLFSLFADEALAAGLRDDAILYEGNSVYVSAQAANILALMVHELVIAAAEHDLPDSTGTLVHLHQRVEPAAGNEGADALTIDWKQYWTDADGPQSGAFSWLTEALNYEVQGEVQSFAWDRGTCRRFVMPADAALAPASLSSFVPSGV